MEPTEHKLFGLDCLTGVTTLLHRVHNADQTMGVWEAADFQWWRRPRTTDNWNQLFWLDQQGDPIAVAIATDWGGRSDLDLVVVDKSDEPVAHGLFRLDPVTGVGFVEPMGTTEGHQRQGLARHLLTAGLTRLVAAGATRLKINYGSDNPASRTLYIEAGFFPTMSASLHVRKKLSPTGPQREGEPGGGSRLSFLQLRTVTARRVVVEEAAHS